MTDEQLDRGTYLCGVLTDAGQLNLNAAWELAEAYHYLRHAYQSSLIPTSEEAQPGSPSPSAPAAAEFWPCVPVEYFDANEPETELENVL